MRALDDIFVDSSAWIALIDKDDVHHKNASSAYLSLLKNSKSLITSNLVAAETYIVLRKEIGHETAMQFIDRIQSSPRISTIYSTESIEKEAQGILSKYADHDFSYTDAVSFSIMKQRKIIKAFSFDKHFVIAGFFNVP